MKFGSLFTGEGLADLGAKAAGFELVFGVELDPRRAAVGSKILDHAIAVGDVATAHDLPKVDLLWASPPCQKFSRVNLSSPGEGDRELAIAAGIVRHIRQIRPSAFVLENVPQYARSRSLALIENALFEEGYWVQRSILCPSLYGVPQTRPRLILRATRGGRGTPEIQLHPKVIGWGEAIGDLVKVLPHTLCLRA